MFLDLRKNVSVSGDVKPDALEAASIKVRPEYIKLISKLSADREGDIDWWVTSLAARNTYICPLYERLCQLELVRKLSEENKNIKLVVDSYALAKVIKRFNGDIQVSVMDAAGKIRHISGFLYRYMGAIYHSVMQYILSRLILKKNNIPSDNSILVDVFFTENTIQDGKIADRFYPGMLDYLDRDEQSNVIYVPIHYRIRNYTKHYRRLRRVSRQVLLKEVWLDLADYLYALAHPMRLRWPKHRINFMGIDIDPLIQESLIETLANSSSIEGLLRYRFAKKLKDSNFQPKIIIEWYENQEVDHGAIAGWRKYYPNVDVVGYQGFIASKHYLSMFPIEKEQEFSLTPTKVAVVGQCMIEQAKEFCPGLEVVNAPAFRFSSVWDAKPVDAGNELFTVLVSLPIHVGDSKNIVDTIKMIISRQNSNPLLRFLIKPHPTWSRDDIEGLSLNDYPSMKLVEGDYASVLDKSDIVVGAASSACVHSVARGIPTIVIGKPIHLLHNPIPDFIDKSLWAICYNAKDMESSLDFFLSRSAAEKVKANTIANDFREIQFNQVNQESVNLFLGLE